MDLDALVWDGAGLVTVVVQDRMTGEVRMVAHADREAVRLTLATGEAHFWSRSRKALWKKGETSGNTIRVAEVVVDCDADCLLYLGDPSGPSCHTGARSCFRGKGGVLHTLWDELEGRKDATAEKSYTRSLLDAGGERIASKVREEADELGRAVVDETLGRVVSESADVVYHVMVALLSRGGTLRDLEAELARRMGTSGHEEKSLRTTRPVD